MTQVINTRRPYDRESFIMIVDDDQTLLKFFKIHLNKFFSRVIVVKNAKEAVDTLKEKQIDLVLSDIRMPRVDGLQLLKKIRNHDASIPVFLISGALIDDEKKAEIDALADGFLKKPFTVEEIHAFIDSGMKKREILAQLGEVVKDNKTLLGLIKGNFKVTKLKDKKIEKQAGELLNLLKAS
jgi:DNA-binding response OmpR family regulator